MTLHPSWTVCRTCSGTGRTVTDQFGNEVAMSWPWTSANSDDYPPGETCSRCGGHGIVRIDE